jgi:hypothetical protein
MRAYKVFYASARRDSHCHLGRAKLIVLNGTELVPIRKGTSLSDAKRDVRGHHDSKNPGSGDA